MKILTRITGALALALSLSSCSLFGVSPEDAAAVRADARRVVSMLQIADATVGVAVTEAVNFCADPSKAGTFPCNKPDVIAAAKAVSDTIGARLADLQALLADGKTEVEQVAEGTRLAFKTIDDVTRILNQLRGISPAAARAVAELYQTGA